MSTGILKHRGVSVAIALLAALALVLSTMAPLLPTGQIKLAHAAVVGTAGTLTMNTSANAATGVGAFTTLAVAPTIPEGVATDIPVGTGVTSTLAAPTGWVFNTAATMSVAGLSADVTAASLSATSTVLTLTYTAGLTGVVDTLTLNGIQVRPSTALTAAGAASGVWADGTATIVGLVGDTGITLTATFDTGNYVTAGSGVGATSTGTPVGSTILVVSAQGTGLTSATFQTTAGTFSANGNATVFCADGVTSCDQTGAVNDVVQVGLILPASGKAVVTVTPAGVGAASTITLTLTAAKVLSSVNVGTASVSVDAAGTTAGNVVFQLRDQNGAAFTTAGTITVSTNLGVIDADGAGVTCTTAIDNTLTAGSDASCTITSQNGSSYTVQVFGNGVSGAATVTITSTIGGATVSGTKAVTISGTVSTLAIKFQSIHTSTPSPSWADASTPAAAATGATFRASITPLDAAGRRVSGVDAVLTFSPASCAATDSLGDANSTGTVDNRQGLNPALAAGTTCTVTATSNLKTAAATFTVGSGQATTSVVTVTAPDVATATTSTITVSVAGSTGIAVADNTSVTLVVTAGAVIDGTVETKNGVASFTYVSPGTAQTVAATAVLTNNVTGSGSFAVVGAVTPPAGAVTVTPNSPYVAGANSIVVQGSDTAANVAASIASSSGQTVSALWVYSAGSWRFYLPASPSIDGGLATFPGPVASAFVVLG